MTLLRPGPYDGSPYDRSMAAVLPPEPEVTSSLAELVGLEQKYLLQNYARYPLALHRGKGCYVYDLEVIAIWI